MFLYLENIGIREILRITYEYPLIKCYTQFSTALPGSAPKSSDWDIAFFWRFINGSAVLQSMYTHVDVKIKFFFILYVATIIRLLVSQLNLLTATLSKVHKFWEGRKILRNLHHRFVLCSASQIARFLKILLPSQNTWTLL